MWYIKSIVHDNYDNTTTYIFTDLQDYVHKKRKAKKKERILVEFKIDEEGEKLKRTAHKQKEKDERMQYW